ncbi:MAG TPA: protein kinase, partial [Candidatus Hydrogenedentes bacterium]|nr:protein kinase [Candidatus Hydrogenedentota bacterium]
MSHLTTCPQCGNQLLSDTPDARCPYCLLQLGLNSPAVSEEGLVRCPSEEQLRLLVEGALSEPEAASVREHVQVCPDCELRSNALRHAVQTGANRAGTGPAVVGLPQTRSVHLASPDDLTVCTPSNQLPDESIPGYQIIQEIHRGGQGVVYQAIQKSTKRRVAIKVMREGPFAGPHERSRFEREVQILAALQHPHIVAVHDSGVASGNFYFAMDYISGDALDRYVEQHDLSVEDALRLFAKVCEAMNAAHLRGIIHRDLKPANIRVDAEGEPHILDFGLARVGLGGLTADSRPQLMTMTGDFVGSPPWAAPEQAEGLPHLIDVRTDVYALGVILFQVLTGEFPYDVTGSILDVLERVRHAEPLRPSTLRRGIGDEVETIILKCLAKDRARRYQSAGEVARDINRYLAGEPIEAKRDSAVYVLKKAL